MVHLMYIDSTYDFLFIFFFFFLYIFLRSCPIALLLKGVWELWLRWRRFLCVCGGIQFIQGREGCFRCRRRTRGSTGSGAMAPAWLCTSGMTRLIDRTPEPATGSAGGAVARSTTRTPLLVGKADTFLTTMASPCFSFYTHTNNVIEHA